MIFRTIILVLFFLVFSSCSEKTIKDTSFVKSNNHSEEINKYVDFLSLEHPTPVDYVIHKFQQYDIVVLGERLHPEDTQYGLIYKIVNDPRFTEQVGLIYTETGSRSLQREVDAYLFNDNLDCDLRNQDLLIIFQNLNFYPVWGRPNFREFINNICNINVNLPLEKKINVKFVDIPVKWSEIRTSSDFKACCSKSQLDLRDQKMAQFIIEDMAYQKQMGDFRNKKALVIMNAPHSYNNYVLSDHTKGDMVTRYLFDNMPGKVANILIHSPAMTEEKEVYTAIQTGRWDAAFEVNKTKPIGFDFENTPFGKDLFDLWQYKGALQLHGAQFTGVYENWFTGFIFDRPIIEHKLSHHDPKIWDSAFKIEYGRRLNIVLEANGQTPLAVDAISREIDFQETPLEGSYRELPDIINLIQQWTGESLQYVK